MVQVMEIIQEVCTLWFKITWSGNKIEIDAVNYASLGNYADFGDSTEASRDTPVGFGNG